MINQTRVDTSDGNRRRHGRPLSHHERVQSNETFHFGEELEDEYDDESPFLFEDMDDGDDDDDDGSGSGGGGSKEMIKYGIHPKSIKRGGTHHRGQIVPEKWMTNGKHGILNPKHEMLID